MNKYLIPLYLTMLASLTVYSQVPEEYYFIVPGTMSYRLDGSENPELSDELVRGTYYGADVGGAMTWFNSSQYKDFALFHDADNPNLITHPDDANTVPEDRFVLNYRIAYPSREHYTYDTASKEQLFPLMVFMHGAGERADCWSGSCYGPDDPRMWNNDHNLTHGGRQHLNAINADPSDPGHWPGFVVFPQNKNGYSPGSNGYTARVIALVETLIEVYPIDPNRVYINGLSNGAWGLWMLLHSRPDLFAAAAPMSGYRTYGIFPDERELSPDTTMIHIPIWQFQGGEDTHPRAFTTEAWLAELKALGATPRYTLYPNLGHSVWNTAYTEPDFFSWFLQYSKLTIHAFYGVSQVCDVENMNVRLGISKGFDAYEWRMVKDGEITPVPPSPERPNEIIATEPGSYQVRFARGTTWTEWSEPYTITPKNRPTPQIIARGSTALPGLDGSTEVTVAAKEKWTYYEWYKDGEPYLAGETQSTITVSQPGTYTLFVKDEDQCQGYESNKMFVVTEPYDIVPVAPQNISARVSSENAVNIYWEDHSSNELGFEVYRSVNGTDFTWVGTTDKNILMYTDTALNANTEYFYKVRAYGMYGASEVSNVTTVTTSNDHVSPSAPSNLVFDHFAYTEHRLEEDENDQADEYLEVHTGEVVLSWSPAHDNVAISAYKVYFSDGRLATTTDTTLATITGLDKEATYNFYVEAVDPAGNTSNPSNMVSVNTVLNGLYFMLYAGGTWDVVKNFSNWAVQARGIHPNFSLAAKDGFYDEGDDYFAFDFFGYIHINTPGDYTFYTRSDDGSQLWIGSTKVVSNDSTRENPVEKSGTINLAAGFHPITVKYFERSGGEELLVSYEGPGIEKQPIPDEVLRSGRMVEAKEPPAVPANLTADADATAFSIQLTWDDQPEEPRYEIYRAKGESAFEIVHTTSAGEDNYKDEGLEPDQLYSYKLKAINESGASDFSSVAKATTAADSEPPSKPQNLTMQSKTSTQIALSWDNAEDNVGVTSYMVTYFAAEESETRSTQISKRNGITVAYLEPETPYTFTVTAMDASGNLSDASDALTVETLAEEPLAVTFVEFTYSITQDDQVVLEWVTANEINNDYFSVERSVDSSNFTAIGKVNGSGTTNQPARYQFTDSRPLNTSYYRIKQVDLDEQYSYSVVIRVTLQNPFDELTVYPNPSSDGNLNIQGYFPVEKAPISIYLYDMMGRRYLAVKTDSDRLAEGVNLRTNNMLYPGVYMLVISDGINKSHKRVIIQ